MNPTVKKWLLRFVKLAVCAGALAYLGRVVTFRDYVRLHDEPRVKHRLISESGNAWEIEDARTGDVHPIAPADLADQSQLRPGQKPIERGLIHIVRRADWNWSAWAVALMAPVPFILAWRLRYLLHMQGITLTRRDAVLLTFAGNFFNFAMPGTTGGDVYKAYHVARRTHRRVEAVTVIVLDRAIGLVSFLLLSAVGLVISRERAVVGQFGAWVLYGVIAFFVGCALFFSTRFRRWVRFDSLLTRLPLGDKLKRVDETALRCRAHPRQSAVALGGTLFSHLINVSAVYFLARGFAIHPKPDESGFDFYLAVLLATVVGYLFAAVPISISGFGLMEAVFYRVLVVGGWATAAQMLALTLSARLVQIFWSLPGIVVPWLGFEAPPPREAEHAMDLSLDDGPQSPEKAPNRLAVWQIDRNPVCETPPRP